MRLDKKFVDVQPDIVSILIGVNDVWHHAEDCSWIPDEVFEERYRTVLQAIKEKPSAKIMMMEPFLIPVEDKLYFREDLYKKIEIERKLAREYADVYLPTDGLLAAAFIGDEPTCVVCLFWHNLTLKCFNQEQYELSLQSNKLFLSYDNSLCCHRRGKNYRLVEVFV